MNDAPAMRTANARPSSSLGLRWRIKDTFVGYVLGNAGGRYRLGGGASLLPERYFAFPLISSPDAALPRFTGSVAFLAHGGMLQVAIVNPALSEEDGTTVLTIDAGEEVISIATIDALGAPTSWAGRVPRLTQSGRELFGDAYDVGEPLDPLLSWDTTCAAS